jgi:hypothetical protein
MSLVVVFERKRGELIDSPYLLERRFPVLVLWWHEVQIAMLQPGPVQATGAFCTTMLQLLATQLNLFASKRLMSKSLRKLYRIKRPKGTWPRLTEWLNAIDQMPANALSRGGQYKEAAMFALGTLYHELGECIDYAASDFFEQLYARNGCVVILTSGLSVESESLFTSLFINWAYNAREGVDPRTLSPLIFVVDDALPLVRGSQSLESEGGTNPLSTWSFMGRSRRIGIVCAAQNYSLVSPAFRNNAATVLCFGSYGQDAREIARDLHLTGEQEACLPQLQPGDVVAMARTVWPQAVRGRVALIE